MALGLTDHVWSYREPIWLPVSTDPALTKQMDERMAHLLTPALEDQPSDRTQAPALLWRLEKRNRQPLCRKPCEGPVMVLQNYLFMKYPGYMDTRRKKGVTAYAVT